MIEQLTETLHAGQYSCVIAHGTEIRTFRQRGVADLYDLLQYDAPFLQGAIVADKVVGKAAAALMILGNVRLLHADVISQPALQLLQAAGLKTQAGKVVPFIENRAKDGWCPLEKASYSLQSVDEIFQVIQTFIENLRNKERVSPPKPV